MIILILAKIYRKSKMTSFMKPQEKGNESSITMIYLRTNQAMMTF